MCLCVCVCARACVFDRMYVWASVCEAISPCSNTAYQAINPDTATVLIGYLCTYIETQLSKVTVEDMTLTGTCLDDAVGSTGPPTVA